MKILLFHTQDCPHYQKALAELELVLEQEGIRPQVELLGINKQVQAQTLRIPGSPTIRINGQDIEETGVGEQQEFGLGCRLYRHDGKLLGWPSPGLIRQAVRKAKDLEASLGDWDYPVSCCG